MTGMLFQRGEELLLVLQRYGPTTAVYIDLLERSQHVDDVDCREVSMQTLEEGVVACDLDSVGIQGTGAIVPSQHEGRHNQQEDGKNDGQNIVLVFGFDEKGRQSNSHSEGVASVRITEFEAVCLLLLVSKALITL
jgi:hypothetical protein